MPIRIQVRPSRAEYMREYNNRPERKARLRILGVQSARRYRQSARGMEVYKAYRRTTKCRLGKREWELHQLGASIDLYESMLVEQGGVCKCCGLPDPCGRRLAVDHCHETGKVRGLLCGECNLALGHARDNPWRLMRMAEYLLDRG